MSVRAHFTTAQWTMLAGLPIRVGRWMAAYDRRGGKRAATRELAALDNVLATAGAKYADQPLLTHVFADMPSVSTDEPLSVDEAQLFSDLESALLLLQDACAPEEVNCYKLLLIDIAEAVARSAPEGRFKTYNLYNGPERGLYAWLAGLMRLGFGPKVSRHEKRGINKLISFLQADDIVQPWTLDPFKKGEQDPLSD